MINRPSFIAFRFPYGIRLHALGPEAALALPGWHAYKMKLRREQLLYSPEVEESLGWFRVEWGVQATPRNAKACLNLHRALGLGEEEAEAWLAREVLPAEKRRLYPALLVELAEFAVND